MRRPAKREERNNPRGVLAAVVVNLIIYPCPARRKLLPATTVVVLEKADG